MRGGVAAPESRVGCAVRTFKVLVRTAHLRSSLLLSFPASAQPANVRTARAGAFESATVSLPGFLVDAAGVTGPGGRPGVALLISGQKDRKGPKTLLFFDPQRRTLETLAARLHEEVNAVTGFDLDASGALTPIAGMPGVLFTGRVATSCWSRRRSICAR